MEKLKEYKIKYLVYRGIPKEPCKDSGGGEGGMCYPDTRLTVVCDLSAVSAIEKIKDSESCWIKILEIDVI